MKTAHAVVLAVMIFPAGFFAGMKTMAHYHKSIERDLRMRPEECKTDIALRALRHIRANSTNTIAFLETQLDVGIIDLGSVLASTPRSMWRKADEELLRSARDYKAQFPSKGRSDLDRGVSEVFSLLDNLKPREGERR
jgi:hypothetical protein